MESGSQMLVYFLLISPVYTLLLAEPTEFNEDPESPSSICKEEDIKCLHAEWAALSRILAKHLFDQQIINRDRDRRKRFVEATTKGGCS